MNDIKLGGDVDSIEDGEGLQRDLDKTESWSITNTMKFNKSQVSDSAPVIGQLWLHVQTV